MAAIPPPFSWRTLFVDAFGILVFRRPSAAIATHWPAYLAFGLAFTWLAGIGRYWDHPRAEPWQVLGLGSVAYVFCLALLLWLVVLPLRPRRWSYRNVLIFVALTAPPAVLYAIPVERFLSLDAAQSANAWFLAVVATWRVVLLAWFLRAIAGLDGPAIVVATLLPLALIVMGLAFLNLEHVVFSMMSGIAESDRSPHDRAYGIVATIAFFSFAASPFLLIAYVWMVLRAR